MHGAHACLVPINYHTTNVFKQLADKNKAARNTRACDYRHLLLLLPFILSNLFRDEVEEHNSYHRGPPVIDPSVILIGVTNVFLRWYKQFRMTTPGKTAADIGTLRALSLRYTEVTEHYMYYTVYICYMNYINYTYYIFHHSCWICSNMFFLTKIRLAA